MKFELWSFWHFLYMISPFIIFLIIYLLTKNFGREYCERFEDMQLVEKKMAEAKEVWLNEQQNEDIDD